MEPNYAFRRELATVHRPDRRDPQKRPEADEIEITSDWSILIGSRSGEYMRRLARDLQDYLLVSMGVPVLLRHADDVAAASRTEARAIVLATSAELPQFGASLTEPRSYRFEVSADRMIVCGFDERGAGQGSYYAEDLMNLREAPYLKRQQTVRTSLFSPRLTHSGWGLDDFPDEHLNAIAHAGMDAIMIFVRDVNTTPLGFVDFNDLIDRAALFGLDVYAYSYFRNLFHPDDERAADYYESTYGALFEACPRLKGVILVGESCGFPSKDPRTSGELRRNAPAAQKLEKFERLQPARRIDPLSEKATESAEKANASKPNPGWWPCTDFPQLLTVIRDTIHRRSPDAEIVFWTYNWGWAPAEDRLALIRSLPEKITLMATFEMFEFMRREGIKSYTVDYTITFEGPGQYFSSEAQAAAERGIKLYTMSNTGGRTWDIGVIPFVPVPGLWDRRHRALRKAKADWGLSGLMESHHYGWYPSFVSELAKWAFWSPQVPVEQIGRAIAERDYGTAAAPFVLEAWAIWSEAFRDFVCAREDQSGPGRIGSAYPLVFRNDRAFPASPYAMNGSRIFGTAYQPANTDRQSPGPVRYGVEIRRMIGMAERWEEGLRKIREAVGLMPEKKRTEGRRLEGLGQFMLCAFRTAIHVKQWWLLKNKLFAETEAEPALRLLDEMERLARAEIANTELAIPCAEADSRLGWEPSMEYVADVEHLRWKMGQVERMIRGELAAYRKALIEFREGRALQAEST